MQDGVAEIISKNAVWISERSLVVFKYFSGVVGVFASKDLEFKNEKANDYSNWTNLWKTLRKERERERERGREGGGGGGLCQ